MCHVGAISLKARLKTRLNVMKALSQLCGTRSATGPGTTRANACFTLPTVHHGHCHTKLK
jgi:hypothetical protein